MKNTTENTGSVHIDNSSMIRNLQSKGLTETNHDRLRVYQEKIKSVINNKRNNDRIDNLETELRVIRKLLETIALGDKIDVRSKKDIRPAIRPDS